MRTYIWARAVSSDWVYDVSAFAPGLAMGKDEMIVGHLPFLERRMPHVV